MSYKTKTVTCNASLLYEVQFAWKSRKSFTDGFWRSALVLECLRLWSSSLLKLNEVMSSF